MATQRTRGSYYDAGRTYSQAEFNELLRQLAAREDLARRDFSTLQTTYGIDPGGSGTFGSPDEFRDADGMNYWVDYGMPSHDENGTLTREQIALRAQAEGVPAKSYSTRLTDVRRDGTFKIEGLGGDYGLAAIYNPDGTIREIRPYSHGDDSWWTAIRPAVLMAGLAAGGGWLANALQGAAAGAPGLGGMAGQGISAVPAQGGLSAGLGTAGANAGLGINVAPAAGGLGSGLGTVGAGAGGLGLSITPGALAAFDAATGLASLAPQLPQSAQTSVLGRTGQGGTVLDRIRQIGDAAGDLAPLAGLAGLGAGAATVQPPVQPQAPTVPGAEAPPEARGYQAARDPIIDVLQRNRRRGGNRTLISGWGGVPMEQVRTGGNTLLGL